MVRVAAFKSLLTDACAALDLDFGVLAQRALSRGFSFSPSCSPQHIPSATAEQLLATVWDLFLETSLVNYLHFLPLPSYFASILTEVYPVYFRPCLPFATNEISCMGFPSFCRGNSPAEMPHKHSQKQVHSYSGVCGKSGKAVLGLSYAAV